MILLLMAIFILGLTGCSKSLATIMIEEHDGNTMDLSFESLEGEKECDMKVPGNVALFSL